MANIPNPLFTYHIPYNNPESLCPIVLQNAIRMQHMLPNQRAAEEEDHKKLAKLFFLFKEGMV